MSAPPLAPERNAIAVAASIISGQDAMPKSQAQRELLVDRLRAALERYDAAIARERGA